MKHSLTVASVQSKLSLPRKKLEKDIKKSGHGRSGLSNIALPGFENISWQFAETAVKGSVEIVFSNKTNNKVFTVDVPVNTGFLASGRKRKYEDYEFCFAFSLS